MMNLEPKLDHRLWSAIEKSHQSGNYTTAILDSIHFLGELIREKTGLEADGVPLIHQAFGGQTPKLKITKLQTDSDINIHKGVADVLRGLYQAIRNPRSHEKYIDSAQDAEALILFVNYLVTVLDKATGQFNKDEYLQQVFDPDFPENDRYAELLVERIPQRKRWDVLIEVYRRKEQGKPGKVAFFMRALMKALSDEDISRFCEIVSKELEIASTDDTVRTILEVVPAIYWPKYNEVARIRTEAKLIESIRHGRLEPSSGKCVSGRVGTWAMDLEAQFVLKENFLNVVVGKLGSSDSKEHDYVFRFFFPAMFFTFPQPPMNLVVALRKGLKAGNLRFREALWYVEGLEATEPWAKALQAEISAFVAAQECHAPSSYGGFDPGITDDDVPF